MAIAIGIIIILIAVPLTASATMAAVGPVAVVALAGVGIPAPVAAAAVLIFASDRRRVTPVGCPHLRRVGHRPRRPGQDLHPAAQVLLPAHPRHGLPDRRRRPAGLTATSPRRSTDEFDEERAGGGRGHAVPTRTCPHQPVRRDRAVLPARRPGHRRSARPSRWSPATPPPPGDGRRRSRRTPSAALRSPACWRSCCPTAQTGTHDDHIDDDSDVEVEDEDSRA